MLAIAPTFRLPEAVVQRDIARIMNLGVKIELSHPITSPPEELLADGFDAVYVASGAGKDARLGIEGEEGEGVYHSLDFLDRVRRGEPALPSSPPTFGGKEGGRSKVLVIGGGNSAMDAARTARRIASGPVTVVYRRTRQEMPAIEEEVEAALAEGVILKELASPTRIILREGWVAALECVRNELGEPGEDGRRRPIPVVGSEFRIEADSIVIAIGQVLEVGGWIVFDPLTLETSVPGVFAGGDAVRGPATIVEACADGRRAAEAICQRLGVPFERPSVYLPVLSGEDIVQVKRVRTRKAAQHESAMLPADQRGGFDLVEETLTEEAALAEAARCLQCSTLCDKCVEVCPNRANYTFTISPINLTLPKVSCWQGQLTVTGKEVFQIEQSRQIIHVDDFCNECGNCETFCIHHGRPYQDKPRLFLRESDFELEEGNAFYIKSSATGWTIRRREGGKEARLSVETGGDEALFENDLLKIAISAADFQIRAMKMKGDFQGELSLVGAAEMYVILKGLSSSLSFLPF